MTTSQLDAKTPRPPRGKKGRIEHGDAEAQRMRTQRRGGERRGISFFCFLRVFLLCASASLCSSPLPIPRPATHTHEGPSLPRAFLLRGRPGRQSSRRRPRLAGRQGPPRPLAPVTGHTHRALPRAPGATSPTPTPPRSAYCPTVRSPISPGTTWSRRDDTLTLIWPSRHSTDTLILSTDGTTDPSRNRSHTLIRGHKVMPLMPK